MRRSARISLHLRQASSGQEFRIPGRHLVGFAQLRSDDFSPSTPAHFVILFVLFMFILQLILVQIELFRPRERFFFFCSLFLCCTHQTWERSLSPAQDGYCMRSGSLQQLILTTLVQVWIHSEPHTHAAREPF